MRINLKSMISSKEFHSWKNIKVLIFSYVIIFGFNLNCLRNKIRDSINKDTLQYSDEEILEIAYNGPKYPVDFFYEEFNNYKSFGFLSIKDSIGIYNQIATDDSLEALRQVYKYYEESSLDNYNIKVLPSNEKYFEYLIVINSDYKVYLRIHKKQYFEGLKFSWFDHSSNQITFLGKINVNPITSDFVKDFFDRYYFFRNYKNGGAAVLQRNVYELDSNHIKYVMYYVQKVGGDYGIRDIIYVYKAEYIVNSSNGGESKIDYNFIKEIKGKYN